MLLTKPTFFVYNDCEKGKASPHPTVPLFEKGSAACDFLLGKAGFGRAYHSRPDTRPIVRIMVYQTVILVGISTRIYRTVTSRPDNNEKPVRITTLTGLISLHHT